MNFKRNRTLYFILFSILTLLSFRSIYYIFKADGVESMSLILGISILISIVQPVIFILSYISLRLNGYYSKNNILFFIAPLSLSLKSIYSSEYGHFLTHLNKIDNTIILYEQRIFSIHEIDRFDYSGNIESLSNSIKRSLESKYKSDFISKDKNDKFTKWNGFLDKKSERDDKLNNLGIKE